MVRLWRGVLKLAKKPEERKTFKTFCIRSWNPATMKSCWAGQWVRAELSLQDEEGTEYTSDFVPFLWDFKRHEFFVPRLFLQRGYVRFGKKPKGSNLALLLLKVISESAFGIKSAFDVKSAFRYHFCYQKRF